MDPVTLIAPDGTQVTTSDPVEANNLRFGYGYRPQPTNPTPEPPPLAGPGSAKENWVQYAGQVDVDVDPNAKREDIVKTVKKAGQPIK